MDIRKILGDRIKNTHPGPHFAGFKSVKTHIDAAVKHLERGQSEPDEALFTDVIFRCNQAFEGSIKEAYRILANKDPKDKTPHFIEKFLSSENLLRKKVLDQFTTYRKEWRNPSTHDYTLDFDRDEALLAIVTVTAFAIVLIDQIDEKISFDTGATNKNLHFVSTKKYASLTDMVTDLLLVFPKNNKVSFSRESSNISDYYRLESELLGFVSSTLIQFPDIAVSSEKRLGNMIADLVVEQDKTCLAVEIKVTRDKRHIRNVVQRGVVQASSLIGIENIDHAIVFVYLPEFKEYKVTNPNGPLQKYITIVSPNI